MLRIVAPATAVLVCAWCAPAASADRAGGVDFTAGLRCAGPASAHFDVASLQGSLRTVALRVERGVRVRVPRTARGRAVGTLTLTGGPQVQSFTLTVPRTGGQQLTLLHREGIRVVLRQRGRDFLSVTGLPATARSAFVSFAAAGQRIVSRAGRVTSVRARVARHGAATVTVRSSSTCR